MKPRIRLKARPVYRLPVIKGGADLSTGALVDAANGVASEIGSDLDGYVVMGWTAKGGFSIGWRTGEGIGPRMATALICETVRGEIVGGRIVHETLAEYE